MLSCCIVLPIKYSGVEYAHSKEDGVSFVFEWVFQYAIYDIVECVGRKLPIWTAFLSSYFFILDYTDLYPPFSSLLSGCLMNGHSAEIGMRISTE